MEKWKIWQEISVFISGKWNDYGTLRAKDQNDIGRGKIRWGYRGDVTVKIEAEDLQAGDTYSGIQQVFYHVAAEENVQADKEEILFQKEDHQTRGKARWEGAVVIPAEVFNSNDVRVQVTVKDFAGNEKTENKEKIAIDITPPILHVQYDDQMPVNGNYYRKARKATITVHERNFDEKTLKIQAGSLEGRQPISGEWTRQEGGKIRIRIHMYVQCYFGKMGYTSFRLIAQTRRETRLYMKMMMCL